MRIYSPLDWYWYIGVDKTRAYSSKSGDYVPAADPALVAFLADGNAVMSMDTEDGMGAAMAAFYPDVPRPAPAGVLAGYTQNQSDDLFKHKLVKLLFVLINRIQVLEGKQPLTVPQARTYVKGLM